MSVGWQRLSRRERVLVALLGVLLAGATAWGLALEPAFTRIQRLRRDLAATEAVLASHRTAQAALESYRARLANLRLEAVAGARRIPRNLEPMAVAVFVEQAAHGSGVRLLAIDLGAGPAVPEEAGSQGGSGQKTQQGDGRFRSWPVKLEVAGTYDQVLNFVRTLEGWERLWRLARVELVPQVPEAGGPQVSADGQGRAAAVLRAVSGASAPENSPTRVTLSIVLFTDAQAASLEEQRLEELGVTPQETGKAVP